MRRLGLLVLFLLALSLTTAMAASMDVQADNLSSTQTSVSISVPDVPKSPPLLYLIAGYGLSETFVGTGGVTTEALNGTDPFREWTTTTDEFPGGLTFAAKYIELQIYLTSGGGQVTARLYDCPTPGSLTTACSELAMSSGNLGNNEQTLRFYDPLVPVPLSFDIDTGGALRLRISNEPSGSVSVQWGQANPNRDLGLVFSDTPSTPT